MYKELTLPELVIDVIISKYVNLEIKEYTEYKKLNHEENEAFMEWYLYGIYDL